MKRVILLIFCLLFAEYSVAANRVTVILDWFINPDHAPLFVAEQQGFFKEQGIDVRLVGPADPADPPKLVAAGQADIAITYQPQFLVQVDQGLPLMQVGTLINKPLNCLVTLQSGAIKTIADLKNKRIGLSSNHVNNITVKIMLAKHGLKLQDVELINIHYGLIQALLSGKIDAASGIMRNFELTQLALAGHPARSFYPEEHGMPLYSELIFVARKDRNQDPKFSKFFIALKKATAYLNSHPDKMWIEFAKKYPELNNDLNRQAWFATLPYFTSTPQLVDDEQLHQFRKFMQEQGLIKRKQ